jgi:hypothetical protein
MNNISQLLKAVIFFSWLSLSCASLIPIDPAYLSDDWDALPDWGAWSTPSDKPSSSQREPNGPRLGARMPAERPHSSRTDSRSLNPETFGHHPRMEGRSFLNHHQGSPHQTNRHRGPQSHSHPNDVALGMAKGDVRLIWGSPQRIQVAGGPLSENERWFYPSSTGIYGGLDSTRIVYFERGQVTGWETLVRDR